MGDKIKQSEEYDKIRKKRKAEKSFSFVVFTNDDYTLVIDAMAEVSNVRYKNIDERWT